MAKLSLDWTDMSDHNMMEVRKYLPIWVEAAELRLPTANLKRSIKRFGTVKKRDTYDTGNLPPFLCLGFLTWSAH